MLLSTYCAQSNWLITLHIFKALTQPSEIAFYSRGQKEVLNQVPSDSRAYATFFLSVIKCMIEVCNTKPSTYGTHMECSENAYE